MNLICDGSALAEATAKVSKALGQRAINPVLEYLKIDATKGTMTITATDNELRLQTSIVADVKSEGSTLVPGKLFADFVKKLADERIELRLTDNKLRIRYSLSEGEMASAVVDDYPEFRDMGEAQHFVMKKSDFKFIESKVAFAVSMDNSRPVLKGVSLEVGENSVTAVALDGYRLAKCVKPIKSTTALMSAVVPAKSMSEVAKLIDDDDGDIKVYIQRGSFKVDLGNTIVSSVLVDGDFIDYKAIFPTAADSLMTISNSAFEACLERSLLLTRSDKNNPVKLDISENALQLTSTGDSGSLSENIPIILNGPDISLAFNAKYLSEILRKVESDTVVVKMTTPSRPCIVQPADDEDEYMYLIVPVRLS